MAIGFGIILSACNKKDDEPESSEYNPTESVAVTKFYLSPDVRVMRNLDSVFFSIDLQRGIIFNADSLPKGTRVAALVAKISYPSTVASATIEMSGGTNRQGVIDYAANTNDTIDFTGDVKLTLATEGNAIVKTYTLKVNVHKEDPDTVYWDRLASMNLPSRLPDPKAQKTVDRGKDILSLIEETDGSYTVATTSDLISRTGTEWSKNEVSFSFSPVIESLTASPEGDLYILSEDGELMQSSDEGRSWSSLASGWSQIIGMYGASVLGVSGSNMVAWPEGSVASMPLPSDFPVSGFSNPIEFSNRWSNQPTIVIFGGVKSDGSLSSGSWAFDGNNWADISNVSLPPIEGAGVIKYYSFLNSSTNNLLREFEAYMVFGGKDADGNLNNTVYITYDHGINWFVAQGYMQLPKGIVSGYNVTALTKGTAMESNLNDRWDIKRRRPFEIDGNIISWECPYIFLFGGYDSNMNLIPQIRSGVLQRLTFVPLF